MIINYFSIFSVICFFVLAIVLLLKKSIHNKANQYLAMTFAVMGYLQFGMFLFRTKLIYDYTFLLNIDFVLYPFFAACFYHYVVLMTGEEIHWNRGKLWHVISFVPGLTYLAAFPFIFNTPGKIMNYLDAAFVRLPWQVTFLDLFIFSVCGFYFFMAYLKTRNYSVRIKDYLSGSHRGNLKWLQHSVILLLILFVITVPAALIMQSQWVNLALGQFALLVICLFFFYKTVNQSSVFSDFGFAEKPAMIKDHPDPAWKPEPRKYLKSSVTKEDATEYASRLGEFMKAESPYLNSELTIKNLADDLGIPVHTLSQIINQEFHQNFFDFINSYRISQAKKNLLNSEYSKFTLEAIAYDCGFGTKTSFNVVFKKHTGLTPSEYRKNARFVINNN
jgi:AraC-like DNA-binding protein